MKGGQPLLRWGLLAALAILAGEVLVLLRAASNEPAPWSAMFAIFAAAAVVLVLVGWLTQYLWGLLAALFVPMHPAFAHPVQEPGWRFLAQVLALAVVAAVLAGWRLLRSPVCSWPSWALLAGGLIVGLALLWPLQPSAGLVASLMVLIGLTLASVFGLQLRRRGGSLLLSNVLFAGVLAWLSPAAGYVLAWYSGNLDLPWHSSISSDVPLDTLLCEAMPAVPYDQNSLPSVWANRHAWAWPLDWAVLPLMAYGLWRALRRGRKDWAHGELPCTWLLPLVAALGFLGIAVLPGETAGHSLTLAALAVTLSVFCLADVARGIGERLVLTPPPGAPTDTHGPSAAGDKGKPHPSARVE